MGTDWEHYRSFLKDTARLTVDFSVTDQNRGGAPPPLEQPVLPGSERIGLVSRETWTDLSDVGLVSAIEGRRSHRHFSPEPLCLEELSFLLWATQGIRQKANEATAFRTVPSAGCRHALETYVCSLNVAGIGPGTYRYLPVEHELLVVSREQGLAPRLAAAALGFVGRMLCAP